MKQFRFNDEGDDDGMEAVESTREPVQQRPRGELPTKVLLDPSADDCTPGCSVCEGTSLQPHEDGATRGGGWTCRGRRRATRRSIKDGGQKCGDGREVKEATIAGGGNGSSSWQHAKSRSPGCDQPCGPRCEDRDIGLSSGKVAAKAVRDFRVAFMQTPVSEGHEIFSEMLPGNAMRTTSIWSVTLSGTVGDVCNEEPTIDHQVEVSERWYTHNQRSPRCSTS